jgi:uridine phosphorylase
MMQSPLLDHKMYDAPSVFAVENMLREAHRQKSIPEGNIPTICILDPDGDLAQYLIDSNQAKVHSNWACYHTKLYAFEHENVQYGIIPCVVGASFAVLVVEELFASGCQLLISVTSAGQIVSVGQPPYFVLIERALRDEGTSYHYLPPSNYSDLRPDLLASFRYIFADSTVRVQLGATWTTDAPFPETLEAITYAQSEGILGVEMEASALYAFAQAKNKNVICFAHITNQMGQIEGDFEKSLDQGNHDSLKVISLTAKHWTAHS